MTRSKIRAAAWLIALATIVGGLGGVGIAAALASGPPVTAPSTGPGPYYSGPLHVCINPANEGGSGAYYELHTTQLGNCAAGYRQAVLNALTPSFTLELGSTAYTCSADTERAQTALSCSLSAPAPTSSPTPAPSSTSSA